MNGFGLLLLLIAFVLLMAFSLVGLILWLDWKGGQLMDEENKEINDLVEKQQSER